ncbi:MAG: hypothetical protein AB8F78_05185 [Saprospiraceae bacterium]
MGLLKKLGSGLRNVIDEIDDLTSPRGMDYNYVQEETFEEETRRRMDNVERVAFENQQRINQLENLVDDLYSEQAQLAQKLRDTMQLGSEKKIKKAKEKLKSKNKEYTSAADLLSKLQL